MSDFMSRFFTSIAPTVAKILEDELRRVIPEPTAATNDMPAWEAVAFFHKHAPGEPLDPDSLLKIYRRLAKTMHPDIPGGNDEDFKTLMRAYSALLRK